MTMYVKQSTAVVLSFGPFVSPVDGVTLVTSLVSALDHASTGIFLSKNGGALTIRHATVTASTYDAYGNYRVTLDTTDTNTLGSLRMQFAAAASCLPVWLDFMVVPANIWDSLFGADFLQVDATQILGTNVSTPATAGILDVNVKNIDNDAASASGTVTFPNATLASTTNITAGVITTVTNLTNAPTAGDLTATMKTSVTTAATAATPTAAAVTGAVGSVTGAVGSVTGAVGSVTGSVGSVTGNVGGNVTGSVGSVVGAVGSVTGAVGSVTGAVGSVTGAVGSVTGNVGGNVVGSVASVTADVNADVKKINGTTVNGNGAGTPWGP